MRSDIKRIALVVSATLAAACSSTPRTAEPGAGTAAQSRPASQTLAAANNAPATAPAAAAPATAPAAAASTSDVDVSLVKAGYSVQRRHDQVFYCRNEIITGNRIGTRVCLTAAQIQNEKQDVAKVKDNLNQPSNRCLGPECNH
jgi:hypothetical protein